MKNKEGFIVEAEQDHVQAAIDSAVFDEHFTASLVDRDGNLSWPIASFSCTSFSYKFSSCNRYNSSKEFQ